MRLLGALLNAIATTANRAGAYLNRNSAKIKRTLKWLTGIFLVVETVVAGATVMVDSLRKRRSTPVSGFPVTAPADIEVSGNHLQVYTEGTATYRDMLQAIRQAKDHIFFETFIWKGDEVGQLFKQELLAAARRGVEVFCIYDVFANLVVPPAFQKFPQIPHLYILKFPLIQSWVPSLRSMGRDHRKILTVDNKHGFVGGYNIGSLYATQWRDTHLRITGEAVWELENAFRDFWNDHRTSRLPRLPDRGKKEWQPRVRAALNTPNKLLFPVRGLYLDVLDRATERVWITQAYFIPDQEILDALVHCAYRGVDVRVLVPEISNHIAADLVARSYYSQLLEAGVRIFLYQQAMVHAKTATADGRWTTIGTANIDRMSMTGNYEINLEIHSTDLAAHMEAIFHNDMSNARELTLAEWEERGLAQRLVEKVVRPLGPML